MQTKNLNISELEKDKENLVIQPVVQQHPVLSELHSESLNTLRIAAFLEADGTVTFKIVFLRLGAGGNRLNNANAGGRLCFLNLDGKL